MLIVSVGANLIRNADKHRENGVIQSHAFPMHEQPACVLANGWPVKALFPAQFRFGDLFRTAWWNIAAYCGQSAKNSFLRQASKHERHCHFFGVYLVWDNTLTYIVPGLGCSQAEMKMNKKQRLRRPFFF